MDRYTVVRDTYLDASPPTFQPRALAQMALDIEAHLPDLFSDISLSKWWAFQQLDSRVSKRGVPTHADHATVSLNLFLTRDEARVRGGGLHIFQVA